MKLLVLFSIIFLASHVYCKPCRIVWRRKHIRSLDGDEIAFVPQVIEDNENTMSDEIQDDAPTVVTSQSQQTAVIPDNNRQQQQQQFPSIIPYPLSPNVLPNGNIPISSSLPLASTASAAVPAATSAVTSSAPVFQAITLAPNVGSVAPAPANVPVGGAAAVPTNVPVGVTATVPVGYPTTTTVQYPGLLPQGATLGSGLFGSLGNTIYRILQIPHSLIRPLQGQVTPGSILVPGYSLTVGAGGITFPALTRY